MHAKTTSAVQLFFYISIQKAKFLILILAFNNCVMFDHASVYDFVLD